jgi:hypothetical protein
VAALVIGAGIHVSGWSIFGGKVRTHGCSITPLPNSDPQRGPIDSYARAHFAEVYAGLADYSPRLLVYRKPSAAFDAWITNDYANACVTVIDAPHSAIELKAWSDRITADVRYWWSIGVPIDGWGPMAQGTGVEVITTDVDKVCRSLPRRYGYDAPIIVMEGGPFSAQSVRLVSVGGSPAASSPAPRPAFAAPVPAWPACLIRSF